MAQHAPKQVLNLGESGELICFPALRRGDATQWVASNAWACLKSHTIVSAEDRKNMRNKFNRAMSQITNTHNLIWPGHAVQLIQPRTDSPDCLVPRLNKPASFTF